MSGALISAPGSLCAEVGQGLPPLPASSIRPSLRSGRVSLDEAEHFTAQSSCQRRYAPMVFGIIPECRSASFRNKRSASPESPVRGEIRHLVADEALAARDREKYGEYKVVEVNWKDWVRRHQEVEPERRPRAARTVASGSRTPGGGGSGTPSCSPARWNPAGRGEGKDRETDHSRIRGQAAWLRLSAAGGLPRDLGNVSGFAPTESDRGGGN